MKSTVKTFLLGAGAGILTLTVPGMLWFYTYKSHEYARLKDEINKLEKKEEDLIEENKRLVSDISVLSSADRIEKIASDELGMHKAESEDIVRVEITGERK